MNGIFTLFSAIANLARSLNRLAGSIDAVSDQVERRVEIIGHQPIDQVPTLEHEESGAGTNGKKRRVSV